MSAADDSSLPSRQTPDGTSFGSVPGADGPREDELAFATLDDDPLPAASASGAVDEDREPPTDAASGAFDRDQRLHPNHVPASRFTALISTMFVLAGATVGIAIFWFAADDLAYPLKVTVACLVGLLPIASAIVGYAWPQLEYERTRWRLGVEGLEIRRGVVFRHEIFVPRTRIQHTDVAQGPVERRFGLATFSVHTAGSHASEITLEGIAHATALALRDELLDGGEGDGA